MQVSLRTFPAQPRGGETEDSVEWVQTMGRMTFSFTFDDPTLTQDDILVKLAGFQLEVQVKGQKLKGLTGDLQDLVRPAPLSWWELSTDTGSPTLIIQLVKLKHASWTDPWYKGSLHPRRKGHFYWTEGGKDVAEEEEKLIKLNKYETIPPGRRDEDEAAFGPPTASQTVFNPPSDKFLCSPDEIVLGLNSKQDKYYVYIYVHFDKQALEFFEKRMPYEDLVAADVGPMNLSVFIRGDEQNPIISGTFMGMVNPEEATWKMTTEEVFRPRQKSRSHPSPALMVTIPKGDGYFFEWEKIFESCWQHRLMVKNQDEYEDMIDALDELRWIETPAGNGWDPTSVDPEYKASLREKVSGLDRWQEERYDGMPGAQTFRRQGYDINSPDYWENVYDYCKETVKMQGYTGGPKALS